MTRPFGLMDLGLVWNLRRQGITLDMQRAALSRLNPLQAALLGLLMPQHGDTTLTFVRQSHETNGHGFIQVLTCPNVQEWQVIHLAPWMETEDLCSGAGWVSTLVDLCARAGAAGALRIRAGVAAGGAEEEAFRQAGFTAYAREEIYRLQLGHASLTATNDLRSITSRDGWPLVQLVGQVVPPAVQHAEGMTVVGASVPILNRLGVNREQGYVLEWGAELGAYLGLSRGPQGAWARILLHPEARKSAADIVQHAIAVASPGPVLYCAVRDYQVGLRSTLASLGFEFVGAQVWLVKHTTRPVVSLRYRRIAALDKRGEAITTPLHPANDAGCPGTSYQATGHEDEQASWRLRGQWANTVAAPCSTVMREHWIYEYNRRTDTCTVGPN